MGTAYLHNWYAVSPSQTWVIPLRHCHDGVWHQVAEIHSIESHDLVGKVGMCFETHSVIIARKKCTAQHVNNPQNYPRSRKNSVMKVCCVAFQTLNIDFISCTIAHLTPCWLAPGLHMGRVSHERDNSIKLRGSTLCAGSSGLFMTIINGCFNINIHDFRAGVP